MPFGILTSTEDTVNIVLKGENVISKEVWIDGYNDDTVFPSGDGFGSIVSWANLVISGDGKLDFGRIKALHLDVSGGTLGENNNYRRILSIDQGLYINEGSKINTSRSGASLVVVNGGELNIEAVPNYHYDFSFGIFVLNDGLVKSEMPVLGGGGDLPGVFVQEGGTFEVDATTTGSEHVAFSTTYAIFNGGTTSIKGGDELAGMMVGGESMQMTREEYQELINEYLDGVVTLPESGFVKFNDGDITIESNGMLGALAVMFMGSNDLAGLAEGALVFNNNFKPVEPDLSEYKAFDVAGGYVTLGLFSDGTGDVEFNMDPDTGMPDVKNVATKLHLAKVESENEDDSGEEDINVPNTGAFKQDSGLRAEPIIFAVLAGLSVAFITYKTLRKAE